MAGNTAEIKTMGRAALPLNHLVNSLPSLLKGSKLNYSANNCFAPTAASSRPACSAKILASAPRSSACLVLGDQKGFKRIQKD
jgi:hypothetical protein